MISLNFSLCLDSPIIRIAIPLRRAEDIIGLEEFGVSWRIRPGPVLPALRPAMGGVRVRRVYLEVRRIQVCTRDVACVLYLD